MKFIIWNSHLMKKYSLLIRLVNFPYRSIDLKKLFKTENQSFISGNRQSKDWSMSVRCLHFRAPTHCTTWCTELLLVIGWRVFTAKMVNQKSSKLGVVPFTAHHTLSNPSPTWSTIQLSWIVHSVRKAWPGQSSEQVQV